MKKLPATFQARLIEGLRDDRGIALGTVVMIGFVLVMMTAMIVSRGMSQTSLGTSDREFEEALFVAEGGAEAKLQEMQVIYDAGGDGKDEAATGESIVDLGTKEAIIAAADARPDTDLVTTPEGEFITIKPDDADVVYSVGFSPTRDDPNRKVRVVTVPFEVGRSQTFWEPQTAILSDDDIRLAGNASVIGDRGYVHSNQAMDVDGGAIVTGCATGVVPPTSVGPSCEGAPEEQYLPEIDPLRTHYLSQYDVCRGGISFGAGKPAGIYAGPANTDSGTTPATPGEPCSGSRIPGNRNITGIGSAVVEFGRNSKDGVYYIDGAESTIVRGDRRIVNTWMIMAGTIDGDLTCAQSSGNILLASKANIASHPEGKVYSLVAGGDLVIESTANIDGMLATHEQIRYAGSSNINGPVVAEAACTSPGSPIPSNQTEGGATIKFDGGIISDFILKDEGYVIAKRIGEL